MNARAEIPPVPPAQVVPLPAGRRRRLAECTLVPLTERVSALFFDTDPADPGVGSGRLAAEVGEAPLLPPVITSRLALRSGGERHLLLTGRDAASLLDRHVRLTLGGRPAAVIDPAWLQSPLGDAAALIEGLSDEGRRRLLKLFLTTGPSLFGTQTGPAFGPAARRLLDLMGVQPVLPAAVCALGAGCIVSYRFSWPLDPERAGEIVALDGSRSQRLPDCRLVAEQRERSCHVHLHLPRTPGPGATLVSLGPTPVQLQLPGADMPVRPLRDWLEQRDPKTRGWAHGLVEAAAATDRAAAALMRELRQGDGAAPSLAVRHLSATPRGVLFAFDLQDDDDLVRCVRLERGDGRAMIPASGRALRGYAELPRQSVIADRFRLHLVFHSGRTLGLGDGVLAPLRALPASCFGTTEAAALATATLDRERPDRARLAGGTRIEAFGAGKRAPALRMLVPLGEEPDAVLARAALIAGERRGRLVEVICHGPDAGAEAAVAPLAEAAAVFGVPHRLVRLPRAAEPLDCLKAALALCGDAPALLLGANVLPAGPGWLAPWLRRLASPLAVLGGTLLDHNGAVLHAGGALARHDDGSIRGVQTDRGLPAGDLPKAALRRGGLLTAACVGLGAGAAARLAAADEACPGADAALALTAQRLAAEGSAPATLLRARFIRYGAGECEPMAAAVEAHALGLLLKNSFRSDVQELRS